MQKHTRIYMKFFGYTIADFIPCEMCGAKCTDVHHIDCKGMGGSKLKDFIENLMGLCRTCHEKYGDKVQFMDLLNDIHSDFMMKYGKRKI